ncbi:MAG TPA: hypothetical protein VF065_14150 [Ilumatobacter sp.]
MPGKMGIDEFCEGEALRRTSPGDACVEDEDADEDDEGGNW